MEKGQRVNDDTLYPTRDAAIGLLRAPSLRRRRTATFRYLRMVADVLKDPATRAEYDANGKARWAKVFASEAGTENAAEEEAEGTQHGSQRVPAPRLNVDFLKQLL